MINCIAVDDEPLALDLLADYCSRIDYIDFKKSFTKPSEAADYLNKFPVDLLFLDIQMPDISGIDFYKSLKTNKLVIFTTASRLRIERGGRAGIRGNRRLPGHTIISSILIIKITKSAIICS